MELFAGEYTHVEFDATSADEAFLVTAQGMDFNDSHWSYHLHGPDGTMMYGDAMGSAHDHMTMGCGHCCRLPHVTARRSSGRLTLILQRDSADTPCWVGKWKLMVSFKTRQLDAMVMFSPDSLLAPPAAGTLRGPKYSRLLVSPKQRVAQRNIRHASANVLDILPPGANRNENEACDLAVNIYARTRLRYSLVPNKPGVRAGDSFSVQVQADVMQGNAATSRAFARMISPANDIGAITRKLNPKKMDADGLNRDQRTPKFDAARVLARAERKDRKVVAHKDEQMPVAIHGEGPLHVHVENAKMAGPYHLSVYIEGEYCPEHGTAATAGGAHDHGHSEAPAPKHGPDHGGADPADQCGPDCSPEPFTRLLTTLVPVATTEPQKDARPEAKRAKKRTKKAKK